MVKPSKIDETSVVDTQALPATLRKAASKSRELVYSPRLITHSKPTTPYDHLPSPFEKNKDVPPNRYRYRVFNDRSDSLPDTEVAFEAYRMYGELESYLRAHPRLQSSWQNVFTECKIDIFKQGGNEVTLDIIYPENAPCLQAVDRFQPTINGKRAEYVGCGQRGDPEYVTMAASIDPSAPIEEFIELLRSAINNKSGCHACVEDVWALDFAADECTKTARFSGQVLILARTFKLTSGQDNSFWARTLPKSLKMLDRTITLTHPYSHLY